MKRKIAAILAADIAGYSRLVSEDEEETLRRLAAYRGVFDDLVAQKDGRIFNTAGDAVLAEFPSAVEALRCAVDVQESVRTRNLAYPPSRQMVFRIGISIGDVVERDGDLLGDGVNIAARLQSLARPGGICISRSVFEQVANKLSLSFADAGPQQLKNINTPVHAYHVTFATGDRSPLPGWPQLSWPHPSRNLLTVAGLAGAAALLVVLAVALKPREQMAVAVPQAKPNSVASPVPASKANPEPAAPSGLDVEITFWNSIRESADPALLQRYLDRYPDGQFATLARHKIAALREQVSKAAAAQPPPDNAPPATTPPAGKTAATSPPPVAPAPPATVPAAATPPAATTSEKSELVVSLQRELKRVGCFDGEADGIWGEMSRTALKNFARHAKLVTDNGEPNVALLDAASVARERICPLACGADQIVANGRCVDRPRAARSPPAKSERRPARAERQQEEPPKSSGGKMCWGPGRNELVPCP